MSNNTLDFRRHSREIKRHKWLILLSLLAFSLLAVYYCMHHMPEHEITSVMLIEEEQDNGSGAAISRAGGLSQMMRAFSIGGFGASSVDNERIIAETHQVLVQTIKDLELNRTYVGHDGIERKPLYRGNNPIKVVAPPELFDTLKVGLKMKVKLDGNTADIIVKKGFFKTVASLTNATLPCQVKTPYGTFEVQKCTPTTSINDVPDEIVVSISGNDALAEYYRKKIELDLYDKKADAIEFIYKDACPERGIDLLNTLMINYNKARKDHKDEISSKEIEFYDNRIASLSQELNETDNRIVNFKKQNNIVDIGAQAEAMIKGSTLSQQEAVKLQAEVEINQMILNALNNGGNNVLPAVGDETMAKVITQYNELILNRQELERSAKPGNESLIALNKTIAESRKTITNAAQKGIEASRIKLNQLNLSTSKDDNKMAQVPTQEKEYFNLLRDKELKNQLFIFLMQRRESSMLQLTKNTSPSFIIDKAYSDVKPSLLKPIIVTAVLLLMGLLLPLLLILFIMKRRNTLADTFDLTEQWESQAFKIPEGRGAKRDEMLDNKLREIRSRLFEMEGMKTLLVHDITHNNNEVLARLKLAIEKAGKTITVLKADNVDMLYSTKITNELENSKSNDYTFVEIHKLNSTGEITDIISNPNTGLLLLVAKGGCKRSDFEKITHQCKCHERSIVIIN